MEPESRFPEASGASYGTFHATTRWNGLTEIQLSITNGAAEYQTVVGPYEAQLLIDVLQRAIEQSMNLEAREETQRREESPWFVGGRGARD